MSLQPLGSETVRLLSCSLVITSVHTVIKELVENSLDAKATNIEVKIDNFGLDVIEVRDNGSGIAKEEAVLIALPHFTSKLSSFNDLATLESYGFRGEALHSIAAVSSLKVTTCTESDDIAQTYTMDHSGQVIATQPSHLGQGTTISISYLFRNLPVRRQFYKSTKRCKEELRQVEELLLSFGIAHPRVRFVLKHNKSIIWQKMQTSNFKTNLSLVLGSATVQQMMSFSTQNFDPMVKILGYVPKRLPEDFSLVSRATHERMFLIVNQRPVVVKPVTQLIRQLFTEACPSQAGRYPVAVVTIDVPPGDLDVNLEPNKTTVLLHNMEFVLAAISSLLRELYFPSSSEGLKDTEEEKDNLDSQLLQDGHSISPHLEEGHATAQCTILGEGNELRDGSLEVSDPDLPPLSLRNREEGNTAVVETLVPESSECDIVEDLTCGEQDGSKSDTISDTHGSTSKEFIPSTSNATKDLYELLDISDLEDDMDIFTEAASLMDEEDSLVGAGHEEEQQTSCAASASSSFDFTLSQWSRGEALRDSQQKPLEPVKLLLPSPRPAPHGSSKPAQSKLAYKGPSPVYDLVHSRPVKRKAGEALEGASGSSCKRQRTLPCLLDKLIHSTDNTRTTCTSISDRKEMTLSFHFSAISQHISDAQNSSYLPNCPPDDVIGYCDPPGVWLVLVTGNIACFNIHRVCREKAVTADPASMTRPEIETLFRQIITLDDNNTQADNTQDSNNNIGQYLHNICTLGSD